MKRKLKPETLRVPGSLTIDRGVQVSKYKWKTKNKVSFHKKKNRKACVRITGASLIKKLSKLSKNKRKINVRFIQQKEGWVAQIERSKNGKITLQAYN